MAQRTLRTVLLPALFLCSAVLFAQAPLPGLSSQEATCIVQDKYGFLWFGTENGLHRWDGVQMRVFMRRTGDTASLPSSHIQHLHEDLSGTLWVATDAGLMRFNRNNETFTTVLPSKPIASVWEDRTQTLWIHVQALGTNNGELSIIENGTLTSLGEQNGLHSTFINAFCELKSGSVCIGTANGLYCFDRRKRNFTAFLRDLSVSSSLATSPQSRINALAEDADGTLLVGTAGGLFRLNTATGAMSAIEGASAPVLALVQSHSATWAMLAEKTLSMSAMASATMVRAAKISGTAVVMRSPALVPVTPIAGKPQQFRMALDSNGSASATAWWGVANGALRLDTRTGALDLAFHDPSSPSRITAPVTNMLFDRAGALWYSRLGAGVQTTAQALKAFRYFPMPVSALYATRDGSLWCGANASGTSIHFNTQTQSLTRCRHSLPELRVGAFTETKSGTLLAASDVLEQYQSSSQTFTRFSLVTAERLALQPLASTCMLETRAGTLWIGTRFGLFVKEAAQNGIATPFRRIIARAADAETAVSLSVGANSITALLEDASGTLWIGHEGGLDRYNPHNATFTHFLFRTNAHDTTELTDGGVTFIYEDSRNALWVGTRSGFHRFDRSTGRIAERYLPEERISACVEDTHGTLWISTANALFALNPPAKTLRRFDTRDGLATTDFLDRAAARTPDGRLWFGTRNSGTRNDAAGVGGLVYFHPDSISINVAPPPVVLTGIKKFGSPAPLEHYLADMESITFRHDETVIALEFVALNFVNSAKNQYAYKLENFDRDWNNAGSSREAKYTNLPAGEYVFRVKAANNDGVWNEAGASLRVIVLPPWWATWWFRGGALVITLGGLIVFYRFRTKVLAARNQELERVVDERTHALKDAQAQLVQSERLNAAGILTAGVMHEINNPNAALLSAVQMAHTELNDTENYFLSLLQEEDRTSAAARRFQAMIVSIRESLAVALDGSQRIKRIVSGLQGITKHQREGTSVQALAEEISRTTEIVRYQFSTVEIVQHIPPELTLEAYWGELNQAILNLLVNAAQAHANKIIITAEEQQKRVIVSISDDGNGMTEEVRARIFEPFFTTKDVGNSGLGLSITKNIIEKHGAKIEIESRVGVGTTVRMIFA